MIANSQQSYRTVCLALPNVYSGTPLSLDDLLIGCNALNRYKGVRYLAILTGEGSQQGTSDSGSATAKVSLLSTYAFPDASLRRLSEAFMGLLREGIQVRDTLLADLGHSLEEGSASRIEEQEESVEQEQEETCRIQSVLDFLDPQHTLS